MQVYPLLKSIDDKLMQNLPALSLINVFEMLEASYFWHIYSVNWYIYPVSGRLK